MMLVFWKWILIPLSPIWICVYDTITLGEFKQTAINIILYNRWWPCVLLYSMRSMTHWTSVCVWSIFSLFLLHFSLLTHSLQAPVSMKAMCQAAWLLTVAFGNLVVIIVAESSLFENRVSDCVCVCVCVCVQLLNHSSSFDFVRSASFHFDQSHRSTFTVWLTNTWLIVDPIHFEWGTFCKIWLFYVLVHTIESKTYEI